MEVFLIRVRNSVMEAIQRATDLEEPVSVQVTEAAYFQLRQDALALSDDFLTAGEGRSIFDAPVKIARSGGQGASVRIGDGEHEFVPLVGAQPSVVVASGREVAVVVRRPGMKFIYEIPEGSKVIAFRDGFVVAHPEHPPVLVTAGGAAPIQYNVASDTYGDPKSR